MSEPGSTTAWADGQRALRDRAAVPGFAPLLEPVGYRVMAAGRDGAVPGLGDPWRRVILVGLAVVAFLVEEPEIVRLGVLLLGFALIMRWFWRGAGSGRYVAVSTAGVPHDGVPTLVFAIADDALVDEAPAGEAGAFGDLVPGGVLGLVVGGTTVWPTWPPHAGTTRDLRQGGRGR